MKEKYLVLTEVLYSLLFAYWGCQVKHKNSRFQPFFSVTWQLFFGCRDDVSLSKHFSKLRAWIIFQFFFLLVLHISHRLVSPQNITASKSAASSQSADIKSVEARKSNTKIW
jgi:hypothetical protein